jgi:hypothetical protein
MSQYSREDLKTMTPGEINEARRNGELNELLNAPVPFEIPEDSSTITRDDLKEMSPDQLADLYAAGKLAHLGVGTPKRSS